MNRCPPSSFSKYWFGSASMTFHLKGRKAHIFFIKSLISLQESFIQIFMRSISGYVRNTIWPTKHHRSSRECLEDPTVDLSWPDDSQFWSSMTLPIDETEVPKTNDSQSNPLFFDVWNHVFFLVAFFIFDFVGVSQTYNVRSFFRKKNLIRSKTTIQGFRHSLKVYSRNPAPANLTCELGKQICVV